MPNTRRAGVVLVLLSGLVVLLLFLGVLFLQFARATASGGRSAREEALARIAAASGAAYASARLSDAAYPLYSRTLLDRGDDWLCRDPIGTPLERLQNPSFSHGEAWIEIAALAANGLDDDMDGVADENGEGGEWAGVRQTAEAPGPDLDGSGAFSAWSGRLRGAPGGAGLRFILRVIPLEGGIPVEPGNVAVLDRLGSGVGSGVPLLGQLLVANLPLRGWSETERLLAANGYDPGRVRPCLNLRAGDPVSLFAAPREVLAALWTYASAGVNVANLPGDVAGWSLVYSRSASPFNVWTTLSLYPDETGRLVEQAVAWRESQSRSWEDLYRRLLLQSQLIFKRDASDLAGYPLNQRTWTQAKADLAFQRIAADRYPYSRRRAAGGGPFLAGLCSFPVDPDATWAGWGIDRDPAAAGEQVWASPVVSPLLQRCTTAPPVRFSVEALARSAGARCELSSELETGERLELGAQEDFESWEPGDAALEKRGIRILAPDPIQSRRDLRPDGATGRTYPRVTTLPVRNQWAHKPAGDPSTGYSKRYGAVSLATRETGQQGAHLYWPISEDFDAHPNVWVLGAGWFPAPEYPGTTEHYVLYGPGYPPASELGDYFWHMNAARRANLVLGPTFPPPPAVPPDPSQEFYTPLLACPLYPYTSRFPGGSNNTLFGSWISFQCPGFHPQWPPRMLGGSPAPGQFPDDQAFEMWMGPDALFAVGTSGSTLNVMAPAAALPRQVAGDSITIETRRPGAADKASLETFFGGNADGTIVTLRISWPIVGPDASPAPVPPGRVMRKLEYFIKDDLARPSWGIHVGLVLRYDGIVAAPPWDFWTDGRLYLNGKAEADAIRSSVWGGAAWAAPSPWSAPPSTGFRLEHAPVARTDINFGGTVPEQIWFDRVDEIRIHELAPSDPDPDFKARYEMGRYVESGTFTSPTYVLDEPASLLAAQWTGLYPPGFPDRTMKATVEACNPANGLPIAPGDPGYARELSDGSGAGSGLVHLGVRDLGSVVRAFRYKVAFDCVAVPPPYRPIVESPHFESIWFVLRRRGRAPAWTRWGSH